MLGFLIFSCNFYELEKKTPLLNEAKYAAWQGFPAASLIATFWLITFEEYKGLKILQLAADKFSLIKTELDLILVSNQILKSQH